MPASRKSITESTNNTGDKRKRVSAPENVSNKKGKKPTSDEKGGSNSSFWKKKYMLKDGTESRLTPYEHLWNFLAKDDGKYLFAINRWQYKGKGLAFSKTAIAKEAKNYLDSQEVPEKKLEAIRNAIYKINEDCVNAKKMEDASGEGNEDSVSFQDALKRKCPVWHDAKRFYLSKNSGENLESVSTLDEPNNSSDEEEVEEPFGVEDVLLEEPAKESVAERTIDEFFKDPSGGEEKVDQVIANAMEESNALQRKKIHGELFLKFFSELRRENDDSGLNLQEKMELARKFADDEMKDI